MTAEAGDMGHLAEPPLFRLQAAPAMDWPLSKEEEKQRLLNLYEMEHLRASKILRLPLSAADEGGKE
eukprot:8014746-Pyramimonas_sp.AAC.1